MIDWLLIDSNQIVSISCSQNKSKNRLVCVCVCVIKSICCFLIKFYLLEFFFQLNPKFLEFLHLPIMGFVLVSKCGWWWWWWWIYLEFIIFKSQSIESIFYSKKKFLFLSTINVNFSFPFSVSIFFPFQLFWIKTFLILGDIFFSLFFLFASPNYQNEKKNSKHYYG